MWLAMIVHGVWDFLVFAMIPATMDIASFLDLYVPSGILVPVVINAVGIPLRHQLKLLKWHTVLILQKSLPQV